MKIQDLTGEQLDEWVARAKGFKLTPYPKEFKEAGFHVRNDKNEILYSVGNPDATNAFSPTTNASRCFDLISQFYLEVFPVREAEGTVWYSFSIKPGPDDDLEPQQGTSPELAICRAVVASVYGEEVPESK